MGQLIRMVITTVPEDLGVDSGRAIEAPAREAPTSWYADDPGDTPDARSARAGAPASGLGGRVQACWSMCKHVVITAFSCAIAALLSG